MPEFRPGDVFVNHRIEALAGRGGMGVVYRATQLELERIVALKVIAPEFADDPDFRRRFMAESRIAASIEHPNVIPVHDAAERDGVLFIVMRYVDGPDLRELVRAAGTLEPARAARIVAQVASALDAAHERGLVHRDVKPANVLLGPADHAYLTDFGLTKREASVSGVTRTGAWVGTLGYVAPEQIRGEHVDHRADVYALGCVLFHGLTGAGPYVRDSAEATLWAHLNEPPPVGAVPPPFADLIARALAKDPAERFASAGALGRAALAAAGSGAQGDPAPTPHAPQAPTLPPPRTRAEEATNAETRPAPARERDRAAGTAATVPVSGAGAAGGRSVGGRRPPRGPAPDPSGAPAAHAGTAADRSEGPRRPRPAAPGEPARRRRQRVLAVAALLAVAGTAAAVLLSAGDDPPSRAPAPPAPPPRPAGPVVGDPVPVGARPNALTVANGSVWAVSAASGDVVRIDARTGERIDRIDVGEGATSIAGGFGSVWVTKASTGTLLRLDARTGRRSGPAVKLAAPGVAVAVGIDRRSVWVGVRNPGAGYRGPESVVRYTPGTGAQQVIPVEGGVQDLAVGRNAAWVSNRFRSDVVRIDARSGARTAIPVDSGPKGLAVSAGSVWVAASGDDAVTRIDTSSRATETVRLDDRPARVAVGGGSVWVTARDAGRLLRIDPARRRVRDSIDTGRRPFALDVVGSSVWVSLLAEDAVQRVRVGA